MVGYISPKRCIQRAVVAKLLVLVVAVVGTQPHESCRQLHANAEQAQSVASNKAWCTILISGIDQSSDKGWQKMSTTLLLALGTEEDKIFV